MDNPNRTKEKSSLVYPLPTPVEGIDGTVDFRSTYYGFFDAEAPERRNPNIPGKVPKKMYTCVVGGGEIQYPTPRSDLLHGRPIFLHTLDLHTLEGFCS